MRGLSDAYKPRNLAKIRKDLPLYIISGALDPLGGMGEKVKKLYQLYLSLGLNVNFKLYEDVRHELTGDPDNDRIINDMVAFLDKNTKEGQNGKD
jgi:alpha-beta hydrolase superfamily lysophospholipase